MNSSPASARLAYVAYNFPVLTQTFTLREVVALRAAGTDVQVFACRRDPDAHLDPETAAEEARACYLEVTARTALSALGWLLRRPLRFVATLAACLGGRYRDQGLRCRLRAPVHFLLGVALAEEMRRRGPFARIHAQFVDAGSTLGYVASRLLDVPFSFTNHTAYNPYHLPAKARWADLVLSISEFDRRQIADECGPSVAPKIHVNRVGIRIDDWSSVTCSPRPGRVLSVGGMRPKKGFDVLIRAAARVRESGVDMNVRIIGGGPLEASLRRLADELSAPVEFLGAASPEQVRAELSQATAFVLACKRAENGDIDGIPVVLMEAMAAGVPVVSTRLSGVPELIEDGVSGLLAEPGDVDTLADALRRALTQPDLRARLADAGRARAAELHDIDRNARSLARLLVGAARMSTPFLSVVIPAYNEAVRLPPTLETVTAWLAQQDFTSEIVVVDDGSTDDTGGIAARTLGEFPHQVLTHPQNRGKGAGLKTGMVAARGEYVLFTDADLSTPIEEASRFLDVHAGGVPIVIGTRKSKGAQVTKRQAALRERMGRVYTWLSNVLICPGVSDFTCGFKSFSRESSQAIFSRLREEGWAYDTEVLYLSRRLGYPVTEVPVRWANDPSSRVNLLRDSVGSALGLVRIRGRALFGAYERPTK